MFDSVRKVKELNGVENETSAPHYFVLCKYHCIPWHSDPFCSAPHQSLAGKASTPHPIAIAAIIVNYIAIPYHIVYGSWMTMNCASNFVDRPL
jgi:hypothetical protein